MRFDLPDLRLFLGVVDAGSITHGATNLNLSLAAASERLRDMEAFAGTPLLVRSKRGVSPTRAGNTLSHHARLVLRQVGAMHAELSDHTKGFRGSVRLFANSAAIAGVLPDRLGPFLAEHPGADIDLAERPSPEIVKAVAGGMTEIGIISDAADAGTLVTAPFALDQLVLVMPRDHILAKRRRVGFAQAAAEPMIGFDGALQLYLSQRAEHIGVRIRPRVFVRSFDGVCRMAADGAGVGIVPEIAAWRARRSMPLSYARLTDQWAARRLMLCSVQPERLEPLALALLQSLMASDDELTS